MQTIQNLRERRGAIAQNIKKLLDDHKEKKWENSQQEKYDAFMAEIDSIDAEIKNVQQYLDKIADSHTDDHLQESFNAKTKDNVARELYAKFLRGGDRALTAEDWLTIRNTLSTTVTTEGGYSVQTEVAQVLIDALKAYGGMRSVATVINTEMGNPLSYPTSDGTTEVGEIIAENTTAAAADPTFGTVAVNAYKFSSKVVAAPIELLQDSNIDVEQFINRRLVDRLGRITNQMFTTGTGTAQPRGAVTGATAGKVGTTGQTVSVVFNDLLDLLHALDPAYRMNSSVGFMMHDQSFKVVRKLVDSQNRPIFIPGWDGLGGRMSDSLLGHPVTVNQDVPVMAANAKSILFGDFSKYIIRDVMQATLFRFDDSAYVKLGQIGFLMWMRSGGNLVDTAAVKYYQNSAT